jgi:hypothetical protein
MGVRTPNLCVISDAETKLTESSTTAMTTMIDVCEVRRGAFILVALPGVNDPVGAASCAALPMSEVRIVIE